MNKSLAIKFLLNHQPMPDDDLITQEECDTFCEVLNFFKQNPDKNCVNLFINSVSKNTGMGMYESISEVLEKQDRKQLIIELTKALSSKNEGVLYRACWWCSDLDLWDLEEKILKLTKHEDDDIREAASSFVELKRELT